MSIEKGKAMVSLGPGIPWEMREYPLPDVEPDDILVKISMSCICGTDVHHYKGEYRGRSSGSKEKPMILGHEMTGTIYKKGKNVKTDYLGQPLKEGDRIVFCYYRPCGRCPTCLGGIAQCPNRLNFRTTCEEYPHFFGAFAEYYYLRSQQWTYKVPDALSDELVAPVNCAMSTVAYGMSRVRLPFESNVVVQGAGGLGISAVVWAREMGASQVIVIDKLPNRLELVKSFGADHVISLDEYPTPESRIERVREITGGFNADLAVEVVGRPEVVPEGIEMLGPGGTYLTMGLVGGGLISKVDMEKIVHKCITVIGSGNYKSWTIPKVMNLIMRTKDQYPFHKLVSHKFKLENINEAFRESIEGKVIRAAVVPD